LRNMSYQFDHLDYATEFSDMHNLMTAKFVYIIHSTHSILHMIHTQMTTSTMSIRDILSLFKMIIHIGIQIMKVMNPVSYY
jgi:hypothetical protein